MARKTIPAHDEITDDLTGKPVDDKCETVTVTVDKKNYALDLAPESAAALRAFLAGPDDDNRRALGSLIPGRRVGTSTRSTSTGNGDGKREWLRANGYPDLGERGKFTDEMNAAYAAHLAAPAAPAGTEAPAA